MQTPVRNTLRWILSNTKFPHSHHDIAEFFDVKFYPYDPVGADPIFAAVSKKHVCQLIRFFVLKMRPVYHLLTLPERSLFAVCHRLKAIRTLASLLES